MQLDVTIFFDEKLGFHVCCLKADYSQHDNVMDANCIVGLGESLAGAREDFIFNYQISMDELNSLDGDIKH
ncbi:hypothetical protein [Salinimonas chungwhensis]|uniref:hypothetical protein n=1 Tax=Salinimonas chungwhensis TaxID=265425 RepID=UPI00037D3450|nr:hypothetical protein [Salinimonas chungwhensis]